LAEFALMWSDLMEITIVPVLEDRELSEVLQRIGKKAMLSIRRSPARARSRLGTRI
jgi:hypothetical protein